MAYNAFPNIIRTATGRLLLTWSEGTSHVSAASAKVVWSDDDGATWSAAVTAKSGADLEYNGCLTQISDGRVVLAGTLRDTPNDGVQSGSAWLMFSNDEGETWGGYADLPTSLNGRCTVATPLVEFASGRWLVPVWGRATDGVTDGPWTSMALISDDGGATWSEVIVRQGQWFNEWGCAVRPDNSAVAIIREEDREQLYTAITNDEGSTWHSFQAAAGRMIGAPRPIHYAGDWVVSVQRDLMDKEYAYPRGCFFATDGVQWRKSPAFGPSGWFVYGQVAPLTDGYAVAWAQETNGGVPPAVVRFAPIT